MDAVAVLMAYLLTELPTTGLINRITTAFQDANRSQSPCSSLHTPSQPPAVETRPSPSSLSLSLFPLPVFFSGDEIYGVGERNGRWLQREGDDLRRPLLYGCGQRRTPLRLRPGHLRFCMLAPSPPSSSHLLLLLHLCSWETGNDFQG